jgi:hypothetical protein
MNALNVLMLVLLVAACGIAIWSQASNPPRPVLWISVVLICIILAVLAFAGGHEGVR